MPGLLTCPKPSPTCWGWTFRRAGCTIAGKTPAIPGEETGNADVPSARYLVYRGTLRNGRTVVVIWREIKGRTAEDYRRDAAFVAEQKLAEGADEIWVNGDSLIPGACSLDPIFKERLFSRVEA
ncbi:MAG: hypothetical protein KatS3mg052_0668 [Candidatus Roseilinea sp.]|nr:MAG: hypothetical protein KatS3mg052_0668 [Candidatus Roseilinea sp.]